jgi:hypothetical protein
MSYSPTLGRWLEQDPIGYADGMNRYEADGSAPVGKLDPLGLRHVTIRIYIDRATKPKNFNTKAVEAKLRALIAACKCSKTGDSFDIRIADRDTKPTPIEGLGWQWDMPGGSYNYGFWDYWPIIGWGRKAYRAIAKEKEQYIGWVIFVNAAFPLGYTNNGQTQLSPSGLEQAIKQKMLEDAISGAIDWDTTWANFLAHEQLHLGVMGDYDRGAGGAIESGAPVFNAPATVSPQWCKQFLNSIGLS